MKHGNSCAKTTSDRGSAMGRMQAKGKRDRRGNITRAGMVDKGEHDAWIKAKGVEVRGSDLDESSYAYKRIEKVLSAHASTIKILHTLQPIGVCMADARDWDPYKD